MSEKTTWIKEEIDNLKEAGLYTNIRTIDSPMDAWVTINGRRLLNFCANNYLGLANHPRLKAATQKARVGDHPPTDTIIRNQEAISVTPYAQIPPQQLLFVTRRLVVERHRTICHAVHKLANQL